MSRHSPPRFSIGVHYGVRWPKLFTKEEIDTFIGLYEDSRSSEAEIHRFLNANPKFLYALGAYEAAASEVSFPSSFRDGSGAPVQLRLDFLLRDASGIWDIVELKKADFSQLSLIVGQLQRRRFAAVVEEAIAQVKTYLRELDRPEAQISLLKSEILVDQPQAWLIIGREKDLPVRERRLLERELPHQLRLMTYDELCSLAKQRALIVTNTILLPYIEPIVIEADADPGTVPTPEGVASREIAGRYPIPPDLFKSAQWATADMKRERWAERTAVERSYLTQTPRSRTPITPFMGKLKMP
jgi:hypothetical protein